jgi:hypothetical protein
MSVVARLKSLDDRVVPDRAKGRYDAPRPAWFAFSGPIGAVAAVAFTVGLGHVHGVTRVVVCALAALIFATELAAVICWDRAHRPERPSAG